MSLGAFGLFLTGLLVVACRARGTRIRTVFTAVVALLLGMLIAGSNGVLVEPSHRLVDGVRGGVGSVARSAGRAVGSAVERALGERPRNGSSAGGQGR
jgi:hypothetical protein